MCPSGIQPAVVARIACLGALGLDRDSRLTITKTMVYTRDLYLIS